MSFFSSEPSFFVERVEPSTETRSLCVLHAAIARAPATAMVIVVARYRRVMLGSLPPTLCVDAPGGHLARRRGALLRHLRLPRLGHQARLFVHLDPLLARNRRDQLANRFERQIVRRLEMNATLS